MTIEQSKADEKIMHDEGERIFKMLGTQGIKSLGITDTLLATIAIRLAGIESVLSDIRNSTNAKGP